VTGVQTCALPIFSGEARVRVVVGRDAGSTRTRSSISHGSSAPLRLISSQSGERRGDLGFTISPSLLPGGLLRKAQVEEFHVITWESKKEQIFEMPTGGAAIMRQVRICETHAAWQLCCCSWHQPGCHIMRNCLCSSHSCCCTFAAQHMQRGATGSPLVGRHVLRQHVALQPGAAVVASSCFGGNGNAQPRCSCTVVDLAPPHLTNVLACCCLWPVCRAPTC